MQPLMSDCYLTILIDFPLVQRLMASKWALCKRSYAGFFRESQYFCDLGRGHSHDYDEGILCGLPNNYRSNHGNILCSMTDYCCFFLHIYT